MANGRKNWGHSVLSQPPVPRAIEADTAALADVATNAANATNATNAAKVLPAEPKVMLGDDDLIALVTADGEVQPVSLANLLVFLESRYVLTPIP